MHALAVAKASKIELAQGTDRDRARWVLQKSEQSCLVSGLAGDADSARA